MVPPGTALQIASVIMCIFIDWFSWFRFHFIYISCWILMMQEKAYSVLGREEEAANYGERARKLKAAYFTQRSFTEHHLFSLILKKFMLFEWQKDQEEERAN